VEDDTHGGYERGELSDSVEGFEFLCGDDENTQPGAAEVAVAREIQGKCSDVIPLPNPTRHSKKRSNNGSLPQRLSF
jgi:hypothetical protein